MISSVSPRIVLAPMLGTSLTVLAGILLFALLLHYFMRRALREIGRGEALLQKAHEELELLVQERTRALAEANKLLGALNTAQSMFISETDPKILFDGILLSILLSKVEAGKMQLELSRVDITALLKNSLLMIREKALRHGIAVELNIPASLEGIEINGDERKLKQIMFNLLSNAAKFTPDGGRITLAARKTEDFGLRVAEIEQTQTENLNQSAIEISVEDTGIGIKAEDLERIFAPFEQVKGGMLDKTPGTGLGLPLTKELVALHGGRIRVESEGLGKGSRFYVLLPVSRVISDPVSGYGTGLNRNPERNGNT